MTRAVRIFALAAMLIAAPARAETVCFDLTDGTTVRSDMSCSNCAVGEFPPDLVVWVDFADDSTITHASNAVSAVANKAGTQSFDQSTAGAKPTRVAAGGAPLNGQQYLDFDGGDHLSYAPGSGIANGQAGEMWSVYDRDTSAQSVAYEQTGAGAIGYGVVYANQSGGGSRPGFSFYGATANTGRTTNDYGTGITCIHRLTSSSSAYTLTLNGTAETINMVTGSNDGRWHGDETQNSNNFGAHLNTGVASQWLDGQIGEVFVDNATIAAWQATARYAYLSHKFGVALP